MYLGDFAAGVTVRGFFNTRKADGTPITLAGTPTLAVYKDGGTTESTTGVTLTVDFDSRTGLHLFAIDTSDAFYASGSDFRIVITAGTVDLISVVGVKVGEFSINNRSALRPTTAGRTITVDATGGIFVVGDMFGNNLVISTVALEATSQAIKAKTDLITAGQVQIVSPVGSGGNITTPIFAGDDFKASNGRAFEWTIDARTGFSAGTATCRFGGYSEETGDSWNVAGTVTDIGGGEWRLSFDLTKTVTADLSPGFYRWSVELANPGGDEVTEVYNSNANRQAEVRAKQT